MKDEQEVCSIFNKSLKLCFKIPDPSGDFAHTIERPFDHFGAYNRKPLYVETKFLRGMQSFNLQGKIQDHQMKWLLDFKEQVDDAECWIVLGINVARGDQRLYIWRVLKEVSTRRINKDNFLKKELETLPYFPVHKGVIDLNKNLFADQKSLNMEEEK